MGKNKKNKGQAKGQSKPNYKKNKIHAAVSKPKKSKIPGDECYGIKIKLQSPLHISSGNADVNIDADVVHDAVGLPYFPARRFKGLLYESMIEVAEMLDGTQSQAFHLAIKELFQRVPNAKARLILHDFYLFPEEDYRKNAAGWQHLQKVYPEIVTPESVLQEFTTLRYQTKIDPKTGTAADTSLRTMRVLDAGLCFQGNIDLIGAEEIHRKLLFLGIKNLRRAGMNRNRGLGHIKCSIEGMDMDLDTALTEEVG